MGLWQIFLLAVVQGVTEFLPISSSGHLVIVAALTGVTDNVVDLNIVLHVGTLLSILVFYWTRVWRLLGEDRRLIGLLIVGTVPVVLLGVPLKKFAPQVLASPLLAGCMLPVTGLLLLWAAGRREAGEREYQDLDLADALWIGCTQALAILPGISRSGTTISAGLLRGLTPASAATFSFLLAIPAIAGAGVWECISLLRDASSASSADAPATPLGLLLFGAAVAFSVGLVSLVWLVRWLERGRLHYFAWWCIPVGIAVILWRMSA